MYSSLDDAVSLNKPSAGVIVVLTARGGALVALLTAVSKEEDRGRGVPRIVALEPAPRGDRTPP